MNRREILKVLGIGATLPAISITKGKGWTTESVPVVTPIETAPITGTVRQTSITISERWEVYTPMMMEVELDMSADNLEALSAMSKAGNWQVVLIPAVHKDTP